MTKQKTISLLKAEKAENEIMYNKLRKLKRA